MYQVYRRINTKTQKSYVGSTSQSAYDRHVEDDWDARQPDRARYHSPICTAYREHGWRAFQVQVLAETEDKDTAAYLEQHYMDKFNTRDIDHGYNINRAVSLKRMAKIAPKIDLSKVRFLGAI